MSQTSDRNAILMIEVVTELSKKYGFDLEEGLKIVIDITRKETLDKTPPDKV